jgi:hypothetical protein
MPDWKPGDAYVGVVELFAILLPGAMLTAAIVVAIGADAVPQLDPLFASPAAGWVAFVLSAYALGHFVFLVSARIDKPIYDTYRERTWPKDQDHAYKRATALRCAHFPDVAYSLDGPGAPGDIPMNTFNWAQAILMLEAPAAFADVQRYEADSKFFRSLIVVLPLCGLLLGTQGLWWPLLPLAGLAVLSFLRYAERRYKSTQWAFRYVIVHCEGRKQRPA